ncbi:MAG: hypothetical protein ACYSYV_04625 [Planctomycetota bacterium]
MNVNSMPTREYGNVRVRRLEESKANFLEFGRENDGRMIDLPS